MDQTLNIAGKKVTFRKTGATMLQYQRQTGREFFKDLSAFLDVLDKDEDGNYMDIKDISQSKALEIMTVSSFNYMYDMLFVMAKAADPSIPADMLEWLEGFGDFPVLQIFITLLPMIVAEMTMNPKNV